MRVAIYWHNGRSLGHTAECARIASGLVAALPELSLAGITGAYRGLDLLPEAMDVVKLPSFANYDRPMGWQLTGRQGLPPARLFELRAELVDVFLRHYAPDVLLVNHLPYGAERELVPALLRPSPGKRVLTLRGVLFDREKTNREYFTEEVSRWIAARFDAIHVHTDPEVFRLEDHYDVPDVLRERMTYTGYLPEEFPLDRTDARRRLGWENHTRIVVASMGGGQGAMPIWLRLTEALEANRADFDRAIFVTGPYFEPVDLTALLSRVAELDWVHIERYVPEIPTLMAAADLFVGGAGANMLGEILATRCNALVIPRQVREPEQRIHAGLLAARNLVRSCDLPEVLDGHLIDIIAEALRDPLTPASSQLLGGARRYSSLLGKLMGR